MQMPLAALQARAAVEQEFTFTWSFLVPDLPGGSDGKESTCKAGDESSIPGLGRSLEQGKATQSRIPEAEAWWTIVHGVAGGWTGLSD